MMDESSGAHMRFHETSVHLIEEVLKRLSTLSEQTARTREDTVEVRAHQKNISDAITRIEGRQEGFEKELTLRLERNTADVNQKLYDFKLAANERFENVEHKIQVIHEERIAEKAQWRGPEKVIAVLAALASAAGAIVLVRPLLGGL